MADSSTAKTKRQVDPALFELNGKPRWSAAVPQALQHVLAMLIGNIAPPTIIAGALNLPDSDKIMLIQAAMLIGGLTTLLQIFPIMGFGMGLPSVMGVAFAYMPILLTIGLTHGISAIFGAQLVAGFASIFLGLGMKKIRKFFPPIVSGTVVLSIGLSLYETAIKYMGGGVGSPTFGSGSHWIIAATVLIVTLLCSLLGKGYIKVSSMLIGIVAGFIASLIVGAVTGTSIINFDQIGKASWLAPPIPMHFGLTFKIDAIILMILMYVVQAVQTIGDVSCTAMGGFKREATDKELGGAIMGQGLCGMLGSLFGGLPTDPYSQNVGLIVTNKVVSKRVFTIVGAIMVAAGFLPKFGALMTTIPSAVLGGATITVFAAITMSGIELISEQPMNYRNKMIVGISLALGVGVYIAGKDLAVFAFLDGTDLGKVLTASPIILSFLVCFLLNLIIPKDEKAE